VLQERQFERVGGDRAIPVDIRVLAATNRDLEKAIEAGSFRQDLYYRLNVVSVTIPPLRERGDDIRLLAAYFAAEHGRALRGRRIGISPEARLALAAYPWPGNVRELENAIERAVALGETDLIQPEDLPEAVLDFGDRAAAPAAGYHQSVREAKRDLIIAAVDAADGNHAEAARALGLQPTYLSRLIRNLDLRDRLKKRG
jgi:transcriptional regulator with PAS, ATPase and Fis domain